MGIPGGPGYPLRVVGSSPMGRHVSKRDPVAPPVARRWVAAVVALAIAVSLGLAGPGGPGGPGGSRMAPAPPGVRATWLWSDAPPADVVGWATGHGVSQLFVRVPAGGPTSAERDRLRRLADLARPAGIRLIALGGAPSWTTEHDTALAWLRAADDTGLFAGYHLDVEPYLLPGWSTARGRTVSAYLALLSRLRFEARLPLEVDAPFWYGRIPARGGTLAAEVLRRVDAVTVMSYRDRGTGVGSIWSVSRDWLALGASQGKRVRLGAETGPLAECPYCTFAEEGATALAAALAAVDAAAREAPAFAGIAVHHYDSWRALTV